MTARSNPTDFTETFIPCKEFPISESESRLRKIVRGMIFRDSQFDWRISA